MKKTIILVTTLLISNIASAQLSFDRTRVIFDQNKSNSQSIVVQNTSADAPYIAQSWIEDANGNKITAPLAALPILQRINPKQEKQVKISIAGSTNTLPTDRESLLYFNALGVPPKDGGGSQINVVIQSKLKLFYRPKGLPQYSNNGWVKEMKVHNNGNSLTLENPSAYHIVIYALSAGKGSKMTEKDIVLAPFSSETINLQLGNHPSIYYINDYGGSDTLNYNCNSGNCNLVQ